MFRRRYAAPACAIISFAAHATSSEVTGRRTCMCGIVRSTLTYLSFFSSRRRHTRFDCDWSSDVCSSDLGGSVHSENMPEAGHPVGAFAYDPNRKTFIYYCCGSGSNQPENVFYTWWFDAVGQTGRSKQTSPKPGAILEEGSAFDPLNNIYVWHGGGSFLGTWTYNPTTNVYQQQTPNGTAPDASVSLPTMTYNTSDHKVYLFGGQIGAGFSNDLRSEERRVGE